MTSESHPTPSRETAEIAGKDCMHTPGPWLIATSNSWRRVVTAHRMESVCEPVKQNDGHPDLYFRNGGSDGPDARLIAMTPELLDALIELLAAESAIFPAERFGLAAQREWADRKARARHNAAALIVRATGDQQS